MLANKISYSYLKPRSVADPKSHSSCHEVKSGCKLNEKRANFWTYVNNSSLENRKFKKNQYFGHGSRWL